MTFWSQLGSDPLPLSFWKLPQKCYAGDKSFNCESGTTTENDNYCPKEDLRYRFTVVSVTTTTFWAEGRKWLW